MRFPVAVICLLAAVTSFNCSKSSPSQDQAPAATQSAPDSEQQQPEAEEEANKSATPGAEWISKRVLEAKDRLGESPAGKLLWRSIEKHGGLQTWYANGPVYFRFNYQPRGEKPATDTYQTIDTWSSRARHQLADNKSVEFGWTGSSAWIKPADAEFDKDVRFWALTPYYFIAMPFVLADPGVHLKKEGTAELHGRPHDMVRATFGDNVGDSPDDYYIIYLDAKTGHVGGLRYIVSYADFFPEGGHSPEKLMVYAGEHTAAGITLAEKYSTFKWNAETQERGEPVTDTTLSNLEFRPETPDSFFDVPKGAKTLNND